jgi:nucleoside-diphosphate-sugar epimerase
MPKSKSKCGLVLVTGGSGYIAGYCVAQLLNDGWSVRTTVRSLAKTKAVRASIDNIAPKASEIEFVEADLNSDAGWDRAAMGAQYVLHVASPVPLTDPKDDDELIRPARDGTLRVLTAARDIARLHVLAMTAPEAGGQRFYWMSDIAKILKQGLGEEAKKVPFISVPNFVARVAALFDPIVRGRLYELGKRRLVSSEKARRMFDWTSRPFAETVLDTARRLQASRLV